MIPFNPGRSCSPEERSFVAHYLTREDANEAYRLAYPEDDWKQISKPALYKPILRSKTRG